jgi:hypothetical protein
MKIRVTQIDGKLPNLALMRLAAWHREIGDEVFWERGTGRRADEPDYDVVYGSAIFSSSVKAVAKFRESFPDAIVGGSGGDKALRVEQIVPTQFVGRYDYSGYPDFTGSIGYAMRGCRFKCGFCVVPGQEGDARSDLSIHSIWRGAPHPKQLHLLDNDFFGNPEWRERVEEIVRGGFQVCINQGINVRLLSGRPWNVPKSKWTSELLKERADLADEQCLAIVRMAPRDDSFERRRLYCAWDNLGDEEVFFEGIDRLERHGWKPSWVMAYMLVGYDPRETWERIFHRFNRMVARGMSGRRRHPAGQADHRRPCARYAAQRRLHSGRREPPQGQHRWRACSGVLPAQ